MSITSILIFFLLNGIMLSTGSIFYLLANMNVYMLPIITIIKNFLLLGALEKVTHKKEDIGIRQIPIEDYKGEFMLNVINASCIESIGTYIAKCYILSELININMLIYFIPISFIFELIFDFFHYWSHYYMHKNAFLYKHSHKKHHKFKYPIASTAFYQHSFDLLFTNVLPILGSLYVLSFFINISFHMFCIMNMYKTYIEIGGHIGKKTAASSFPQCIWLPRIFGIELYTDDHDNHHSKNNCNYSKRFIIWDKLFGTVYKC